MENYELPALESICKIEKEEILSEDLMLAYMELEDKVDQSRYLEALKERATALKCKQAFLNILKAYVSQAIEIRRSNNTSYYLAETGTTYSCGAWMVSEELGVRTFGLMGGELIACYHVIIPVKRFTNLETNEEMVTLMYKRPEERWREIIVKRSVIANASKITELASKGVAVTSETARNLVSFLADFENNNYMLIPIQKSTSKMGWTKEGFVPIDANDIIFDGEAKFRTAYEALVPSGSYEEWLKYVKKIRKEGKFENIIYLTAAFASVLVEPLDCLPFILDLYGASGRGKTVALMMACSVWANPREGEYISGANSTLTALELKLNFLNHLPLLVDDMAQLKLRSNEDFSDFIYRVCAGRGKSRGNVSLAVDTLTTWSNITLTNAERPMTNDNTKGGAVNRIIDVPIGENPMFEDGNAAAAFFKKNYGWAGREFVKVVEALGIESIRSIADQKRRLIQERIRETGQEKEEKQILPIVLLLTADEILADHIFLDDVHLDFDRCFDVMKGINDVSENERAWEYLLATIGINGSKFISEGMTASDEAMMPIVWGKKSAEKCIFIKKVFDEEMRKNGFDPNSFLAWMANKGKVERETSSNRPSKSLRVRGTDPTVRCVVINLPNETDFEGAIEEDVPFK